MAKSIKRFLKYSVVGVSTFVFDLALLYILTDFLHVNYVIAAGLAFLIAVSINYAFSRKYVFKGASRSVKAGYVNFLGIVCIGLLLVMAGMYVMVDIFGFDYLISRVVVAALTSFWNYFMNLFFNFKVAGKH